MTRPALLALASLAALAGAAAALRGPSGDAGDTAGPPEALEEMPGSVEVTYPRPGTIFPPELPPPEFRWRGPEEVDVDRWIVRVDGPGLASPLAFEIARPRWRPGPDVWRDMKAASTETPLTVTVLGAGGETVRAAGRTHVTTSTDPVGAPILYRSVPLPFIEAVRHPERIRWRLLNVAEAGPPPVVLEDLPVCGNCHSADAAGRVLGMDVDYANDKGSYALVKLAPSVTLTRDHLITWSDFRREDGEPTFGLLSRVSPDGRYVASTVQDRSVFVPRPDLAYSQLFFPVKGILAVYERATGRFAALPGADDPAQVQSGAAWSPDGRWVYFSRAKAAQIEESAAQKDVLLTPHLARDFVEGRRGFRFDLYRVPFRGGAGGEAEPVSGASANGRSNYFPRVSPDGRWLVFCQAADFMLLQPDAALYIMPAAGGTPRRMTCNTGRMNSWHAWSPNGRWLVFATKLRGPYTQLALTHVDAEGRDSPPVILEHAAVSERACNIPEFLNRPPGEPLALGVDFLDGHNYRRQGQVRLLAGDATGAVPLLEKALKLDPSDAGARLRLAAALVEAKRPTRARDELARLIARLERADAPEAKALHDAHCHAAALARAMGRAAEAADHYRHAIAARPENVDARILLALVHASEGDLAAAETVLAEAAEIAPDRALVRMWLGQVRADLGRRAEALAEFRAALSCDPASREDAMLLARRASVYPELAAALDEFLGACARRFGVSDAFPAARAADVP